MHKSISDALYHGGLIIAHRGARAISPENTLPAAQKAMYCGAHMLEIDVRLSRDGHLIVVHDETLERTSDAREKYPDRAPWRVSDFTLVELRTLDFGSWFCRDDPFGTIADGRLQIFDLEGFRDVRVPALEDILLYVREHEWLVNIEIKDLSGLPGSGGIIEKTVALVNSLGMRDRVLISSFNHEYLLLVKQLDMDIHTGALASHPPGDIIAMMRRLQASTYNPALRACRPRDLVRLKKHGHAVLVWVVNNPRITQFLLRCGIDGVFTDFPDRLNNSR